MYRLLLADGKMPWVHTFGLLLTNFAGSPRQAEYCHELLRPLELLDPLAVQPMYAALIQACLRARSDELALDAYSRLKHSGAVPESATILQALESCVMGALSLPLSLSGPRYLRHLVEPAAAREVARGGSSRRR